MGCPVAGEFRVGNILILRRSGKAGFGVRGWYIGGCGKQWLGDPGGSQTVI